MQKNASLLITFWLLSGLWRELCFDDGGVVGGFSNEGEANPISDCRFLIFIGCNCVSSFEAVVGLLLASTVERATLGLFLILAILWRRVLKPGAIGISLSRLRWGTIGWAIG